MIPKINLYEDALPWQTRAYHLAARQKELTLANHALNGKLFYVEIAVGGRILPHAQPQIDLLFCLEGQGTLSLGKAKTTLKTGDILQLPAEEVRGMVNEGQQTLRLLLIRTEREEEQVGLREWVRRISDWRLEIGD